MNRIVIALKVSGAVSAGLRPTRANETATVVLAPASIGGSLLKSFLNGMVSEFVETKVSELLYPEEADLSGLIDGESEEDLEEVHYGPIVEETKDLSECGPPHGFEMTLAINKRGSRQHSCFDCEITWHCFDIELHSPTGVFYEIHEVKPDYSLLPFMTKMKANVNNHCVKYRMIRPGQVHADLDLYAYAVCFETGITTPVGTSYIFYLSLINQHGQSYVIPTFVSERENGGNSEEDIGVERDEHSNTNIKNETSPGSDELTGTENDGETSLDSDITVIRKNSSDSKVDLIVHLAVENIPPIDDLVLETVECTPYDAGDVLGRLVVFGFKGQKREVVVQDTAFGADWDFTLCFFERKRSACLQISIDLPTLSSATKSVITTINYNHFVLN